VYVVKISYEYAKSEKNRKLLIKLNTQTDQIHSEISYLVNTPLEIPVNLILFKNLLAFDNPFLEIISSDLPYGGNVAKPLNFLCARIRFKRSVLVQGPIRQVRVMMCFGARCLSTSRCVF